MLRLLIRYIICLLFTGIGLSTYAQVCPENIGVEDGTFTNWQCYTGSIDNKGVITLIPTSPQTDVHTVLKNTSPQAMDPYGNFPLNCPNGSGYFIQLGNNSTDAQAERITYTYTVPTNKPKFNLLYYYAVVLQSGGHLIGQEPVYQTSVKDITSAAVLATLPPADPAKLSCNNKLYSPIRGSTGFKTSTLNPDVSYKDWNAVIINLDGYAGHTIEISFTTNDCTQGSHFGYAYIDFTETCDPSNDGLITGNKVCAGAQSVTLNSPPGFQSYQWYDEQNRLLGSKPTLAISPAPAQGTKYRLLVTPNAGEGCAANIYTEIVESTETFKLQVQNSINSCRLNGVDLTQDAIKAGSTPGLKYQYYSDADARNLVSNPKQITTDGIYYIKGSNNFGCTDMQPISVHLSDGPVVNVNSPAPVCYPTTVDLTTVFTTIEPGVNFIYYTDPVTKTPIANYRAVTTSGTYYAEATSTVSGLTCSSIQSADVIISPLPQPVTADGISGCSPVNLNTYKGADPTLTYEFFTDAQGSQPVADPANITLGGAYYYRAVNQSGCTSNIAPFNVTVFPQATFSVTDSEPVVKPQVIDLTDTHLPVPGLTFTYWQDAAAQKPLINYQSVSESGTYYIKAVNGNNCSVINPVHVIINEPPGVSMIFKNTFSPNGDGVNDKFAFTVTGTAQINYLKIYNRYGQQVFETTETSTQWDGNYNGRPQPAGTYYWVLSCYDTYYKKPVTKSGPVTIIR